MRPATIVIALLASFSLAQAQESVDLSLAQRMLVQDQLIARNLLSGKADGQFGPKTRAAISSYQEQVGASPSGALGADELATLLDPVPLDGFTLLDDQDLPQGDYRSGLDDDRLKGIDLSTCLGLCSADSRCQAFTYNAPARVCFLKSDVLGQSRFAGAISGYRVGAPAAPQSADLADFEILRDTDLPQFDYRSGMEEASLKGGTLDSCQAACANDGQRCQAFTFNAKARVCFLKSTAAGPERFVGAISGRRSVIAPRLDGWETDPQAIIEWARATVSDYRAAEVPIPSFGRLPLLDSPEVLGFDPAAAPLDISAAGRRIKYSSTSDYEAGAFQKLEDRPYVSEEHLRILSRRPKWEYNKDQSAENAAYRRGAAELESLAQDLESDGSADSALLAAIVRVDLAEMSGAQLHGGTPPSAPADVMLVEAMAAFSRPMTGDDRLERAVYSMLGSHVLHGGGACNADGPTPGPSAPSEKTYIRAAALFRLAKAYGPSLDALAKARECAAVDAASAVQELAVDVAREGGNEVELASALLDLALLRERGEADRKGLILAAYSVGNGRGIAGRYGWGQGAFEHYDELEALGLSSESDFTIANFVLLGLADGIKEDNVSRSWYEFSAETLERLQRFETADKFYAHFTFPSQDASAHPATYLLALASKAISLGDFDRAASYARRVLDRVPAGTADRVRLSALDTLANALERLGDFSTSAELSREALVLANNIAGGNLEGIRGDLESRIARASVETGNPVVVIRAQLAEFDTTFADGCGIDAEGRLTALPQQFLFGDLEPGMFFASRSPDIYRDCIQSRFELFETKRSSTYGDQLALSSYFHVLAVQNDSDAARAAFGRLLSVNPRQIQSDREDLIFAQQRYLERLVNAVVGTMEGGDRELAGELLDKIWPAIEGPTWYALAGNADGYVETPANYVVLLAVLGRKDEFLQRAGYIETARSAQSRTSCYGPPCEVAIEYAVATNEQAKLAGLYSDLEVGLVISSSGASADPSEIEAIRSDALFSAARASRWGLSATARGYYQVAGATKETVLGNPNPLASLNNVEAFVGLADTFRVSAEKQDAYAVSRHLVLSAREMVDGAGTFADDALLRWSKQLRPAFSTYLETMPLTEDGFVEPEERDLALFALQFIQTSATAATFTKLASRSGSGDSELVRRYQDLQPRLTDAYAQLASEGSSKTLLAAISGLEAQRKEIEDAIAMQDPRFFTYGRLQFTDVAALREVLLPDEAVFSAAPLSNGIFFAYFDGTAEMLGRVDGLAAEDLSSRVNTYRAAMVLSAELNPVPVKLGHDIYELLFGKVAGELIAARHLVVVFSDVLEGVPLSALVTDAPSKSVMTASDLMEEPPSWLIAKLDMSVVPSLASLAILRRDMATSKARHAFFGVGNPTYAPPLAPLPETAAEVRYIAALLGADPRRDLLLAGQATKAAVLEAPLGDYRVLAFATHGFLAGGIPNLDEPALALTAVGGNAPVPAYLTASDVAGLRLDSDVVLLSACSTAGSDGTPGADGLSGFANAFFFAGARNLVVTHWSIPSGPAIALSTGMIEHHAETPGSTWSQSLRAAVLSIIDQPKTPLDAHPVSWAGHFVVGAT